MGISFRHSAGFGKRMEYNLVGKMLMEGLDVYLPLVDDHGVDCVIKKEDGTFIEVQIKARSSEVTDGDAALFSAIIHDLTKNFYFVFYSERLEMMWILSSEEFLAECVTNKTGKNAGMDTIGVGWGFRGFGELRENGAVYLAEKAEDILKIVCGENECR